MAAALNDLVRNMMRAAWKRIVPEVLLSSRTREEGK